MHRFFKFYIIIFLTLFHFGCQDKSSNSDVSTSIDRAENSYREGDFPEALKEFSSLKKENSKKLRVIYGLGVVQSYYCNNKDTLCYEALTNLETVFQINPNYESVNYNLGILYYRLGLIDKSLKHYLKEVDLVEEPDNDLIYNLAIAYLEIGENNKACALLNQVKNNQEFNELINQNCLKF